MVLAIIIIAAFAAIYIPIGVWVYRDAKKRGINAWLWVAIVLLSGNFIGLLIYFVVDPKENGMICPSCGKHTSGHGTYCPHCGQSLGLLRPVLDAPRQKKKKRLVPVIIVVIGLLYAAFIGVMLLLLIVRPSAHGFRSNFQSSVYDFGFGGDFVRQSKSTSSGDTWKLAFEDFSDGYEFTNTYNARDSVPKKLTIETVFTSGAATLRLTQSDTVMDVKLEPGTQVIDLSGFSLGKIKMSVTNRGAQDFECEITAE